ncbi:FYVE zinc finger family protein [Babesia bovis T2Bo]|uniref:FYVE-type domain-containing protein n=1 Tax=Babesia bovis TaxID=5865 RepID=A7APZ6_BABBO|nr:FYVE zinc finger family protein [Babesia bovis T2Bo]EDO08630.1 FYVE zinc finger family protein [Babesia bovis T2Bo]|eukprot:XP_001612198.1 hypothetical protein [Babesia bovis T2Bo]
MKSQLNCAICGEAFSLIIRRRVCKQCNRACCINCIDKNYVHPGNLSERSTSSEPSDTCTDCILAEATNYSISVQEELDVTEEINRELKRELKRQMASMEKFRSFLLEFCQSFSPESSLFTHENDDMDNRQNEGSGKIDPSEPIASLIDMSCSSLQNLYTRLRIMRSELDTAQSDRANLQRALWETRQQLDAVSHERDAIQASVHRINETLLRLEAEQQQVADLKRDYDALRVRCLKMEQQQNHSLARHYPTSLTVRSESQEGRPHNMALFSLCCPRIGF